MTDRQFARSRLTDLIERYALNHDVTFIDAAREITNLKNNFFLVATGFGKWWKDGTLTYAMLCGLRDHRKYGMTKHLDKLNEVQILEIQPYLPVKKRIKRTA